MSSPTWIRLEDAKRLLRFDPGVTSDDIELQAKIDAAAAMIEDIKGHVEQGTVSAELQEVEHLGAVFLDERPVLAVTAVRAIRRDGTTVDVPQTDPSTNVLGWQTPAGNDAGVLQVPNWGPYACSEGSVVSVDYTFGLESVPANYVEAAKELVRHLWISSQDNASGGRPGVGGEDTEWMRGSAAASYAMPFRVRELLGIFGSVVKSSGVRVL